MCVWFNLFWKSTCLFLSTLRKLMRNKQFKNHYVMVDFVTDIITDENKEGKQIAKLQQFEKKLEQPTKDQASM